MTALELIEHLRAVPPDTQVLINDADTDWLISISSVTHDDESIVLIGDYGGLVKR